MRYMCTLADLRFVRQDVTVFSISDESSSPCSSVSASVSLHTCSWSTRSLILQRMTTAFLQIWTLSILSVQRSYLLSQLHAVAKVVHRHRRCLILLSHLMIGILLAFLCWGASPSRVNRAVLILVWRQCFISKLIATWHLVTSCVSICRFLAVPFVRLSGTDAVNRLPRTTRGLCLATLASARTSC